MLPNNEFPQRPEMTSSTSSTTAESILGGKLAPETANTDTFSYPKHSVYCDCSGSGIGCECARICRCTEVYVAHCECGRGCHYGWDPCMLA
ncbi:predicted protein [Lichtheimia corymbifera JMRC:FSU:9682]|uniref:Uncharacterized protein n=1 Tax=Lichtheimia corymbifera JMRC:FSU:9682 TaxID=1263082 RepID=A0A068RV63_9FUNG|nr:predicted protein [Lichtheimia corymbifera JMRC:FSU:9682]